MRLLIAAGVGMITVDDWGADMFGLSIMVACASIASATVCFSAARLGLIWPAPVRSTDQGRGLHFFSAAGHTLRHLVSAHSAAVRGEYGVVGWDA